ncbi:MAG: LuxR C-terminal-related transcriptional regulator [Parachlamydia sp.]|nr:LuxR C-terminal-related transcriptional regulator [Parachlamydia sp.]
MNETTLLLRFFKTSYFDRVKKLCDPLKDAFGIDTFWHSSIGPKGEFTHFSNTPEGTCHYFEEKHYLGNPFLRHPSNYGEGFYLLSDIAEASYMDAQKRHNDKFGIDHLLFFCKHQQERCHIFGFATTQKNLPMQSIYLNNILRLRQFSGHFLEQFASFSCETFTIELPKLVGSSHFFASRTLSFPYQSHFRDDYQLLSRREKECLQLFLEGHTAAETAALLTLSRRTVETYFENIKDKLGCNSKAEILKRFSAFSP